MFKVKSIADSLTKASTFIPAAISIGFSSRYNPNSGKYNINMNYRKFEAAATGLNSAINLVQAVSLAKQRDIPRAAVATVVGVANGFASYTNIFSIRYGKPDLVVKAPASDLAVVHGALALSSLGSAYASSGS